MNKFQKFVSRKAKQMIRNEKNSRSFRYYRKEWRFIKSEVLDSQIDFEKTNNFKEKQYSYLSGETDPH
jgi:ribosome-associated toxin RatA of RatAB toxin-antitoxin module